MLKQLFDYFDYLVDGYPCGGYIHKSSLKMLYNLAVGPEAVMLWDIETGTR